MLSHSMPMENIIHDLSKLIKFQKVNADMIICTEKSLIDFENFELSVFNKSKIGSFKWF